MAQLRVAPKQRTGKRPNLTWVVMFDPVTRKYNWRVEFMPEVQVFSGSCDTDELADAEVQKYLTILPK